MQTFIALPIELLHLRERTYNALARAGVDTIPELEMKTDERLLGMKGIGVQGLKDVRDCLASFRKNHELL